MKEVTVTHENGVELTESKTIGIYSENIISTKEDVNGLAEIVYADTLDRRMKPPTYRVTNTKTVIDGFISGDKTDLTVYDVVDGTRSTLTVQDKFIRKIRDAKALIAGTITDCAVVTYIEGSFVTKTVYTSDALADLASAVVTTTTTTAAVTTTTTTAG